MTIERNYTGPKPETVLPAGTIDTQMHMYLPGFPAMPGGPPLPEGLPGPAEYRKVMDWLGISRVVITQGNAHQFDNANLLACLGEMGDVARGVAVITGETGEYEMARLHAAGVCGARIMDLPGGAATLTDLEAVDALAANAGWMVAVQFDGSDIASHFDRLAALQSRYVIDHHGKFFRGAQPGDPEVDCVKRLIDKGNCWFKFAGCYESSKSGAPGFEDIAAISREIACYAPERIVWGTNWPHNLAKTTEDYPDDAALLDTVLSWFPDERSRELALVSNAEALFAWH